MLGPFVNYNGNDVSNIVKFLRTLLSNVTISNVDGVKVGMITQGRVAQIQHRLGELSTLRDIRNALSRIRVSSFDDGDLKQLAKLLQNEFFQLSNGARLDVPKSILVFTNGDLSTNIELQRLKEKGFKMIVVGYGKDLERGLYTDVVSGEKSLFLTEDTEGLKKIVGEVQNQIFSPGTIQTIHCFYLFLRSESTVFARNKSIYGNTIR